MAKKIIKAQMKQRLDTQANWAAKNPVLLAGELGLVSDDPNLYKVGDGATSWNALPFRGFDGTLVHTTGDSETAVMSQKGVTKKFTEINGELQEQSAQIVELGAKLNVFQGRPEFVYSAKTEDDLYQVNESTYLYYGYKLYGLPANIGEVKTINDSPFSLTIERVSAAFLKITGLGIMNLKSRAMYFGSIAEIPHDLIPTDEALDARSRNYLPNSVITDAMNKKATKEEVEALEERIDSNDVLIEDLQNTKIDRENDDYYPKMAVGLADNLVGVDVVDSEINFRRSGGGAISDGVARIESIKGNSVVWNQLADSLKVYSISADANIQIPIENVNIVGGRKYIAMIEQSVTLASAVRNTFFVNGQYQSISENYSLSKGTKSWLFTANQSGQLMYWCNRPNVDVKFSSSRIYDLTKMFGAGNEPTTIEEFYSRIPMGVDLNAYNEGEVIHMDVQSIESVGVNQWDEEWELGGFSANGEPNTDNTRMRTKNPIRVIPNSIYKITSTTILGIRFYDQHGVHLGEITNATVSKDEITIPANAYYMKFSKVDTITYNHDVCINLSDSSVNGKYFPYIKRTQSLDIIRKYFPQGMKSAGSAHDEIRYNKATQKWEKVVRIGSVDLGSLNWIESATYESLFYAYHKLMKAASRNDEIGNIISSKYRVRERDGIHSHDKSMGNDIANNIFIMDTAYTDAASFKAAMAGVILYYELAEPIVTELDEADQFKDLDYQVWNAGTEKAIAEGKSAPLAADITYGFNAYGTIKGNQERIAALEATIAQMQAAMAQMQAASAQVKVE